MKILITGAQGVGKSTLAKEIAEVKNIELLPEVARVMIEEGYGLDMGATEELERTMLHRQMLLELEDNFVADRGIVDILAYCMILFEDQQDLLNEINNSLIDAKYDIIFYLPIEFPIEDDGIRSTDKEFQKKIDQTIKFILEASPFKWYEIKGSKEQRLNKVLDKLLVINK